MKTIKVDLKEVEVYDLLDQQILLPTPYQKDLGNHMYISGNSIEMADLGKKIFYADRDGYSLDLTAQELEIFISTIDLFRVLGQPLHDGIKSYLTIKLENLNK